MASLGGTTDPRALVPGDAAVVHGFAAALSARATHAEETASSLAGIRASSWTGESADAFWEVMNAQPRSWRITADALSSAAGVLTSYADVLVTAQADAATAIELWARAQAATQEADETYRSAARAFQHAVAAGRSAATPTRSSTPGHRYDVRRRICSPPPGRRWRTQARRRRVPSEACS